MSLHPLPVDLELAAVLGALKNFQADPGEGAHAAWHAAGFAIGLFHKNHEGLRAVVVGDEKLTAALADLEASAPSFASEGVGAIDWNVIKPWAKKLLEFLIMVLE